MRARLSFAVPKALRRYRQHATIGVAILFAVGVISLAVVPLFCHLGLGVSGAMHCHALPEWLLHAY